MNFKKVMKTSALVAALGLSLTAFNPAAASAATPNESAQKLVDSLKALNLNQVDYLYTYLQSVNLTDAEYNKIVANAEKVTGLLEGVSNPSDLTNAQKAEAVRLFVESSQLAHLQVAFVDNNGKAVDLTHFDFSTGLLVQVKDNKGKVLGTINPTKADLEPANLTAKLTALKTAVDAKVELDKTGKFVPMPGSKLPNTATNSDEFMLLGALIVAMGGISLIPAVRKVRKLEA
ncbi:cell wall anchor protein [Fredinandcohnia onubensis]|uniref:cell wall anchor protein n=1 Tax=Fredinandcohnia onubensis TaxID=1571209 RepID=UPI000C0C028B|nr:cell wall anchor protein [Fredinandcohnia onubensis]